MTSIESGAFSGCSKLTSVKHTGTIDQWVQIDFNSNPLYYVKNLYINNELVTEVNITTATKISAHAFEGCSSLTSVRIGNSVTSIESGAFSGCSKLTSVKYTGTIDQWVQIDFNSNPLYYAKNLYINNELVTEVNITTATKISAHVFEGCSSLTSVRIGNGVTSIGVWAFNGCSALTSVTIPDSVTSIESGAFYNCSALTSVTIPDSVTSICYDAFYGCPIETATIPTCAIDYIRNNRLKTVTITSGDSIGARAFYNCSALTSVTIPDSVTSIGESAFDYCSSLTSVNYTGTIDQWAQIDFNSNPLYYAKKLYINNELVTEVNITTATKISAYAFEDCWSLTSVTIGDSVTSIGSSAFYGCTSLTSVTIPDSVTSIGASAFRDCSKLTSITIGSGVTSIGSSAFYGCTSLTSVTIPDSVTSIGSHAFEGCSSLTSVTIGEGVTSIGSYTFYNCMSLTSVYYKGTETGWNNMSFNYGNSYLTYATRYYYSESNPFEGESAVTSGNYWHYDTDGKTPVVWTKN